MKHASKIAIAPVALLLVGVGVLIWRSSTAPLDELGAQQEDDSLPSLARSSAPSKDRVDAASDPALARDQPSEQSSGRTALDAAEHDSARAQEPLQGLVSRYPHLADRLVLDGVPLRDLDLEGLSGDELRALAIENSKLARENELELIESIPSLEATLVPRRTARALYDSNPSMHFAELPATYEPETRFKNVADLSTLLSPELIEARGLAIEISAMGAMQTALQDAATHMNESADGKPVVRWDYVGFGEKLVGYAADGSEVCHAGMEWPGSPH